MTPVRELIKHQLFALTEVYARKNLERPTLMMQEGHQRQAGVSRYARVRDPITNPDLVGCDLRLRVAIVGPGNLSRTRFGYPAHPMSASRLYTSTGKPYHLTSRHGGFPLKGCNRSTMSELRAAEAGYDLCYRMVHLSAMLSF